MKLAHRLLLSSIAIIIVLSATVGLILERRLHRRVQAETIAELSREARLVASQWTSRSAAALAHSAAEALGHRVTLVGRDGTVLGDSEFDSLGLSEAPNHADRPEIARALSGRIGASQRISPTRGHMELYVAVPAALGAARVSEQTLIADAIFDQALWDIAAAAVLASIVAVILAALFARSVSRPVVELRDIARAIADGDLSRRPAISAPGEVGDLANALYRLSEQLGTRVRALQDEEALLSAVVDSLNEGVLTIGPRQMVVRINSTARGMLGLGSPVPFSVDHLPREGRLREALARALNGQPTENQEIEISGKPLALEARPLANGAVLAFFDLSALRRLETVRRDFVANVSHELRTPLTVVKGFAETLADTSVGEPDRLRFASLILANTERMQRIVDELLDLSRIESGGWVPRPATVDFRTFSEEIVGSWSELAKERSVSLETEVADDARWLQADRTALRQVIGNLVENALQHTVSGKVTICSEAESGGRIWIGVRDMGAGISPEHLPRIFERFYRADPARTRSSGGVGLGLSIVKHLVEAHGGVVRADSRVGEGTTVMASFARALPEPASQTARDEVVT